jgi:hypothetical protein
LRRFWLLLDREAASLPPGLDWAALVRDLSPHVPMEPSGIFGLPELASDASQQKLLRGCTLAQRCAIVDLIERNAWPGSASE